MDTNIIGVDETSRMTGTAPGTLRYWRSAGIGPKSFKIGRRVVYRREEVERWLAEQEAATGRGGDAA